MKTHFLVLAALLLFTARPLPAQNAASDPFSEAQQAFFRGDLEQSLQCYGDVSEKDPRYPEALLNRAILFNQLGRLNDALLEITRCEYFMHNSAFVHRTMGWLFFSQESYNRAIHFFKESLNEDPNSWESSMGLAWAYAKQNDFKESLAAYQKTLSRFPDVATVYYLAGRLFERMENEKSSLTLYQKALSKDSALTEAKLAWNDLNARIEGRGANVFWLRRLLRAMPGSGSILRTVRWLFQMEVEPLFPETAAERRREPTPLVDKNEVKQKIQIPFFRKRLPAVRIGLGTDRLGRPLACGEATITCSGEFDLFEGTEAVKIREGEGGDPWTIQLGQNGLFYRVFPTGGRERLADKMISFVPRAFKGTFSVQKTHAPEDPSESGNWTREVRGVIEVHPSDNGIIVVNQVPMKDYLTSVVPAEITKSAPLEAMKAQAVLCRSLAILGRFHEKGYDLCDDQHCQVYRGLATESPLAQKAVYDTAEEVMVYRGKVAHTVYSSNCGGRTISGAELEKWGGAPYWEGTFDGPPHQSAPSSPLGLELWLKGTPQVFCRPSRNTALSEFRWSRIVSARALEDRLKKSYPDLGKVLGVVVGRRALSGHALTVEIIGSKQRVTLDQEHRIRYLLTPGGLRSTLISVQTIQEAGRPALFLIWGGGWGHGVGFCQSGAMGMAQANKKYTEILAHYYPACRVGELQE